jgi:hypothetical protein
VVNMNVRTSRYCRELAADSPVRSPFDKVLSLGFYDGTTSGAAQCSHCAAAYRYELVAWDSGQDVKIYSIAALPIDSFETLVTLVSAGGEPNWPLWLPKLAGSDSDQKRLLVAIQEELDKAEKPKCVVASRNFEKEVLKGKELTEVARTKLPRDQVYPDPQSWDFWRAYLEI